MDDLRITGEDAGPQWLVSGMLPNLCEVESCLKAQGERRVFLIADSAGGKQYVLKTSPAEDLPSLLREYELLFKLHDDAFAHPIACGPDGERALFLREYLPGETLQALVEAEGAMDARRAADIAVRVCAAIGTLHSLVPPVIHRDIKPENVLLRGDGGVCLIDLEASGVCVPANPFDTKPVGTVLTAAPEQFGYRRCDERTDVYGIGVLMVYLTTGGYDVVALGPRHVPRSLQRIIFQCLEFDPKRRPGSVKRLGALLSGWRRRRVRWVRRALCAAMVLSVALAIGLNGETLARYIDSVAIVASEPVYEFTSPLIEKAVRLQLGRSQGAITMRDLAAVTELYLCAETPYKGWFDIGSYGVEQYINGVSHLEYARLDDLSDLQSMPNLRLLSLNRLGIRDISEICRLKLTHLGLGSNQISDISPLFQMNTLAFLDLSNNPVYALDGLENCPNLSWLNISAVPVLSLTPLTKLHLQTLLLYDMLPAIDVSSLKDMRDLMSIGARNFSNAGIQAISKLTNLESVGIFNADVADLTPLKDLKGLSNLMLVDGPLTSVEGVSAFDRLTDLDVGSNRELKSIEPLRGNAVIKRLKVSNSALGDLSVLETMPSLTEVICSQDQKPLLDALSGSGKFAISYQD